MMNFQGVRRLTYGKIQMGSVVIGAKLLYHLAMIKTIKLFKMGVILLALVTLVLCSACNNTLHNEREDLSKIAQLLGSVNVLGDSFRLETANKDQNGNKENRYGLFPPAALEKHIFVVEFNGNGTLNRQKLADLYAAYLRDGGEEVSLWEVADKNMSVLRSIAREDDKIYLSISKFKDSGSQKVLKNEYLVQLSEQQDNKKYIEQVTNDFLNTDIIPIRNILLDKHENITNVSAY